ncbi:unnamed protein product [Durusdinium trenchii]|uniref:Pentatricopeptide repeat-containing protein, chloroplastic n=1 Tax=Durusdinium trenchii TaxID=1381693 RepID=A0ABP0MI61_9DINO
MTEQYHEIDHRSIFGRQDWLQQAEGRKALSRGHPFPESSRWTAPWRNGWPAMPSGARGWAPRGWAALRRHGRDGRPRGVSSKLWQRLWPSKERYERQVTSSLRSSRWALAAALIDESRLIGSPLRFTPSFVLHLARVAPWQVSLDAFLQLREEGYLEAPQRCTSAVLAACLLGGSTVLNERMGGGLAEPSASGAVRWNEFFEPAQGDWQKMLFLVDSLLKQLPHLLKGEDASIAFNIPLQACFKSRKWEHVLALLSQMCRHHVPRSVSTLGSALAACERSSQWSRALSVLQHAEHNQWPWRRIQPNVVCFNSAIAACQHVAEWRWSLRLLWHAIDLQLHPDAVTVASALRAAPRAVDAGAGLGAARLLEELDRRGTVPVEVLKETERRMLSHVGSWLVALQHLEDFGGEADATSLNSTLVVMKRERRWLAAMQLLMHPSADAISAMTATTLQEECQQPPAMLATLPRLARETKILLVGNAEEAHGGNGLQVALECWDLLGRSWHDRDVGRLAEWKMGRRLCEDLKRFRAPESGPRGSRAVELVEVVPHGGSFTRELLTSLQIKVKAAPSKFMLSGPPVDAENA